MLGLDATQKPGRPEQGQEALPIETVRGDGPLPLPGSVDSRLSADDSPLNNGDRLNTGAFPATEWASVSTHACVVN